MAQNLNMNKWHRWLQCSPTKGSVLPKEVKYSQMCLRRLGMDSRGQRHLSRCRGVRRCRSTGQALGQRCSLLPQGQAVPFIQLPAEFWDKSLSSKGFFAQVWLFLFKSGFKLSLPRASPHSLYTLCVVQVSFPAEFTLFVCLYISRSQSIMLSKQSFCIIYLPALVIRDV